MNTQKGWSLWLRWIVANSIAETLGLGATFAVGFVIFFLMDEPQSLFAVIGMILLMTTSGALEGAVVGLIQWSVLRRHFPQISLRSWLVATLIGALVAWFLGSLPSMLMSLGSQEAQVATQEPETSLMLLMSGAMGVFLGLVLGFPQWRVLHRAAKRAWLWIPANSAAWALGMPLVFATVDLAQRTGAIVNIVVTMVFGLAITGAAVGAVHGAALVKLASQLKEVTEAT